MCCFRGLREGIRLSRNASSIDIIARTRNRRGVHRNPERHTDSSVTVHMHTESAKIRIKRGVRQEDTITPNLFTATLESIFRRLHWENKGVKVDGEFLSNLRFADDIFLCTETPQELQQLLQELSDESRRMRHKMNIAKAKGMVVDNTPLNVNNVPK